MLTEDVILNVLLVNAYKVIKNTVLSVWNSKVGVYTSRHGESLAMFCRANVNQEE